MSEIGQPARSSITSSRFSRVRSYPTTPGSSSKVVERVHIDDFKNTYWTFDVPVDSSGAPLAGGLVLQDVSHAFHHFAKDIRCIGLWIETELVDPTGAVIPNTIAKEFFALEPPIFTLSP